MSEGVSNDDQVLRETATFCGMWRQPPQADGIDLSLLEVSLSKSPWERMLANDDALNLAESLQAAMLQYHAKS